jgi:hypothetical protein
MSDETNQLDFAGLYTLFQAPITALNCGERCAPYNEHGVPFCCDRHHAIPTAYQAEWEYLQKNTDLWRLWQADDPAETERLQEQTPDGMVLIACKGYQLCQRNFRSLTCRAFPFFPYLTREGEFIGMSYYWEYEDRCWVISNLRIISAEYRQQFIAAYDHLFEQMPEEEENFRQYSILMRRVFGRRHRSIPLLHRNGRTYKITPHNGRMRSIPIDGLPKFGPYATAARLPFPDEITVLNPD